MGFILALLLLAWIYPVAAPTVAQGADVEVTFSCPPTSLPILEFNWENPAGGHYTENNEPHGIKFHRVGSTGAPPIYHVGGARRTGTQTISCEYAGANNYPRATYEYTVQRTILANGILTLLIWTALAAAQC